MTVRKREGGCRSESGCLKIIKISESIETRAVEVTGRNPALPIHMTDTRKDRKGSRGESNFVAGPKIREFGLGLERRMLANAS